jgi:AraC-like DNA-binding protein
MLALELGFSSHAHFTQAFGSEFGHAPSAFSRQLSMRGSRGRVDSSRRPSRRMVIDNVRDRPRKTF